MVSYSIYESDNRVRRYAETLVKQGYKVDAVGLCAQGRPKVTSTIQGVRFLPIQSRIRDEKGRLSYLIKLLAFFVRSMWFLIREHNREPYDLIHVHSVPDFEVFAAWYPRLKGAKIILDIHDIVPEFYVSKFRGTQHSVAFWLLVLVERLSTRFSDHVIASNHTWQKRLAERSVELSKLTTIINFPDTRIFHVHERTRADNKFIFLYPGSLNYHQGVDIAIRAFARVTATCPDAELHIYGSGEQLPSLLALVKELTLEENVLFKSTLPIDQIARVMEKANVGLVPKRKDGFGNEAFSTKILEFMAMGVPVIVPDSAIDTYYFNPSVVQFFNAGQEQSLADAMLLLAKDSELRQRLSKNASEFVRKYTWEVNEDVYLDMVNQLLKTKPAMTYVS